MREIFNGPVPGSRFPIGGNASEHIRIDGLQKPVNLPQRLALAIASLPGRELIEEAPPPEEIKAREPARLLRRATPGFVLRRSRWPHLRRHRVGKWDRHCLPAAESKEDLSATKIVTRLQSRQLTHGACIAGRAEEHALVRRRRTPGIRGLAADNSVPDSAPQGG
jgi:hypothetical protein